MKIAVSSEENFHLIIKSLFSVVATRRLKHRLKSAPSEQLWPGPATNQTFLLQKFKTLSRGLLQNIKLRTDKFYIHEIVVPALIKLHTQTNGMAWERVVVYSAVLYSTAVKH